jgi:membrane-associated phospholipid phosphatase
MSTTAFVGGTVAAGHATIRTAARLPSDVVAQDGNNDDDRMTTTTETTTATTISSSAPSSATLPPSSSPLTRIVTAVGSTTSVVVAGTFYAFICHRRDALMVGFFVGAISNGILSKVLKRILRRERPKAGLDAVPSATARGRTVAVVDPPSDHGMPSSHAMSLGFIFTFTALSVRWTAFPLLVYAVVSLAYRIRTHLHSPDQILVGSVVGSINGAVWWSLCLGSNPYGICVNDWVAAHVLNARGVLPWPMLAVPALVGAVVVGSVERRLVKLFKTTGSPVDGPAPEGKQD